MANDTPPPTPITSRDHIISVARAAESVIRLEGEVALAKANLKLAETEFNFAVSRLRTYAQDQLQFDFTP